MDDRRRAVFLDRDDTLIACASLPAPPWPAKAGDLVDPGLVRLLPGVAAGCRHLAAAGLTLVMFTNQGCVARGAAAPETVESVNDAVRRLLAMPWLPCYYCPFHPSGQVPTWTAEHPWRKPGPGMLLAAASELAIHLAGSYAIGDAPRDVQAAVAAGVPPAHCHLLAHALSFSAACEAIISHHAKA